MYLHQDNVNYKISKFSLTVLPDISVTADFSHHGGQPAALVVVVGLLQLLSVGVDLVDDGDEVPVPLHHLLLLQARLCPTPPTVFSDCPVLH